jgi:hypothetical protein
MILVRFFVSGWFHVDLHLWWFLGVLGKRWVKNSVFWSKNHQPLLLGNTNDVSSNSFKKKKQIEPSHIRKQIKRPSHAGPNKMGQTGRLGLLKKIIFFHFSKLMIFYMFFFIKIIFLFIFILIALVFFILFRKLFLNDDYFLIILYAFNYWRGFPDSCIIFFLSFV